MPGRTQLICALEANPCSRRTGAPEPRTSYSIPTPSGAVHRAISPPRYLSFGMPSGPGPVGPLATRPTASLPSPAVTSTASDTTPLRRQVGDALRGVIDTLLCHDA